MKQYYWYRVFDLTIRSEIESASLIAIPQADAWDVDIAMGNVPPLDDVEGKPRYFQAIPEGLRMFIPEVMRCSVVQGSSVIIEPMTDDMDRLRVFVIAGAMSAILHQRGYAVIHGNAVVMNDQAYIFSGPSGIGKSTLAATFHQRGFGLLADDIVAIRFDEEGIPWALPSFPHVKLWEDAIESLELSDEERIPLFDRITKFVVPMSQAFYPKPCRVMAYYSLHKTQGRSLYLEPLKGAAAFSEIQLNVFRDYYLGLMGKLKQHFELGMALAKKIKTYRLYRPEEGFYTHQIVDAFQKGELK